MRMSTSGVSRTEAHAKRSRKTPAERRAELVEAAALVFLEKGYEAATVVDITGRASSSHGTFYVYFDSKEEIFDAVNVCAGQSDRPAIERIRDILKINSGPELTGWWVEEFSRSNMTHLRERLIHKALETFLPVLTDLLREAVFEGSIEVPFPEATSAFLIAGGLIQRFGLEATGGVTLEQWTMAYDDFAERVLGLRGLDETTHPRLR